MRTVAVDGGPGEEVILTGSADAAGLEQVHNLLEEFAGAHSQVPSTEVMLFTMAVMEVANNIVEHGHPQGTVQWEVRFGIVDGAVYATFTDTAEEFVPDLFAEMPEAELLAEGGRGIPLVRTLVDELDFDRVDDRNHWRLLRRYADRT